MRKLIAGATLALALASTTAAARTGASADLPVPTLPSPSQFVSRVTNPWFPLRPGTVYRYTGVKDGKTALDVMTVTPSRTMIAGIQATVVHDRLYLKGRLEERTTDWYAQDTAGNVWYLGESTAELDPHGRVISTSGSWKTGVSGAHAGIFMPGHPFVGQAGRQEFLKGQAEDQFKVLSLGARVRTPGASSNHALLTQETTTLEPGVLDHKLYVKGVGTVIEDTIKGPVERLVLQSVHTG
jgi:hypothetical protein